MNAASSLEPSRPVKHGKNYVSAINRLAGLPDVFTGSDLTLLCGWSKQVASTYLASWRRAGLIKSLGGRADVHMNLVVERVPALEKAFVRAYPLSCKIGADILRNAGWTTQIVSRVEVAIPSDVPVHGIEDLDLALRPVGWFHRLRPGMDINPGALTRLRPAWALAEMIFRAQDRRVRDAWLLAPDDLELEEAFGDPEMPRAAAALGVEHLVDVDAYEMLFAQLESNERLRDRQRG